jgi:hypothetical protein
MMFNHKFYIDQRLRSKILAEAKKPMMPQESPECND